MHEVVRWDAPEAGQGELVGGKARNLSALAQVTGLTPPPWFTVSVQVFRRHLDEGGLRAQLVEVLRGLDPAAHEQVAAAGARARALVTGSPLPAADAEAVRQAHAMLFRPEAYVAVRSSALGEDSARLSFAGQMDTYLFVRGADGVLDAVRRCFASGFSDRAIAYRLANGLDPARAEVAVVVQEMVDAEASGVLFTANPVTNDRDEMLVNATWGLGEGVVQGEWDTDTYRLPKAPAAAAVATVAVKALQYRLDPVAGAGSVVADVPAERRELPCLDATALAALLAAGLAAERHFGRPQDLEFAVRGGRVYVLQSRPITTLPPGPEDGNKTVWDNSNIIESYAGVTTPLTFSFIRHAYSIVYDQFTEVMGVPAEKRRANQGTFKNMLGLLRGRVYYNLRNWYKLVSLFPGFEYNRDFMEQMMGVKERWSEPGADEARPSFVQRYLVDLPRLLMTAAGSALNFFRIKSLMDRFLRDFRETYQQYRALDLDTLKPHELLRIYQELEERVLRRWKPPIMSDFFAMIFYGTLKKLIVGWNIDPSGSLQNDLICGEGGVESTEPPKILLRMAQRIVRDPATRAYVLEHDEAELLRWWRSGEAPSYLARELDRYLALYGERAMNELKLEEPSMRENPVFLFTMLKNYVRCDSVPDPDEQHERELAIRDAAEAKAREALGASCMFWVVPRIWVFDWVVRNARLNVKNRENQRFARTKIFALCRDIFRGFGRAFEREGILRSVEDVFYLEVEEVFDYVKGTATCSDLQGLADVRRREFDRYRDEDTADRVTTYGPVYHRNVFARRASLPAADAPEGCLKGIPCCPGVVRGPIKRILSPKDDMRLAGEILVAEKTDPGWIPLYPSASAILIERGSILSHSAIVAREMGKPTIVGIPGLIAAVADGQVVEMDGSTGIVRLRPEGDGSDAVARTGS